MLPRYLGAGPFRAVLKTAWQPAAGPGGPLVMNRFYPNSVFIETKENE